MKNDHSIKYNDTTTPVLRRYKFHVSNAHGAATAKELLGRYQIPGLNIRRRSSRQILSRIYDSLVSQ